jgi:homoserine O-acetyltransferase/O-succinyltransferase
MTSKSPDNALFSENERTAVVDAGRQYAEIGSLELRAGGLLESVTVAYETWGELNEARDNAILVCHALSGDSHAIGWWDRLVGPGLAIDTNEFYVVGSNVLGGCQGSTGPSSVGPNGQPYGSRFPAVQIEDMVVAQERLMRFLGIDRWALVAGGSMGGMQALSWAVQFPDSVARVWCTASCAAHDAMQIGFNESSRQAILRDPEFRGGDYYDSCGPVNGLAVARMIGHLSYLSEDSFRQKFGRRLQDKESFAFDGGIEFAVESYLNYQGDKFTARFDANTLLVVTRAIDFFELSSLERAKAEFLFTSFDSDWIYPTHQSVTLNEMAIATGLRSKHVEISRPWGHDAFLLDGEEQGRLVRELLSSGK